jgi:uncharacterized damage-inducible protein DinB
MPDTLAILSKLFERDLDILREQIEAYTDEDDLWVTEGRIANSAGNLCLHITGNLRHFVGAVLGETGYVRDRHREFNASGVARDTLLLGVDTAIQEVMRTLERLSEESLDSMYPLEVFGYPMTTHYFLIHLYGHLNYHLGQINYHRRLLTPAG